MGIYLPNMEMPKNCNVCNFHMLRFCCAAGKDLAEKDTRPLIERRPERCPLVPAPPHGRLGDLDKLADNMRSATAGMEHRAIIMLEIRRAPTVIPAEEGET